MNLPSGRGVKRPRQVGRNGLWPRGLDIHRHLPDHCRFDDEFVVLIEPLAFGFFRSRPTFIERLIFIRSLLLCQTIIKLRHGLVQAPEQSSTFLHLGSGVLAQWH